MKTLPFSASAVCALILAGVAGCVTRVPRSGTSSSDDVARPLFQQMDVNHDGQLSRAEFSAGFADAVLTVYNQPRTGSVTAAQWNGIERAPARAGGSAFATLDTNHDGKLTRDEMVRGKERDVAVNRIFDRIDLNHDGVVSVEEGRPSGLDRTPEQRAEGRGL